MAKSAVNRYVCKLKLIQYGLLLEAQQLDDIQIKTKNTKKAKPGAADDEGPGDDIETEDEDDMDSFFARRERFVNKAIRRSKGTVNSAKVMSVAEVRRALVKEFLGDIIRPKKCNRCQA